MKRSFFFLMKSIRCRKDHLCFSGLSLSSHVATVFQNLQNFQNFQNFQYFQNSQYF